MEEVISFKKADKRKHFSDQAAEKKSKKEITPPLKNAVFKTIEELKLTDHPFILEIGFENAEHLNFLSEKAKRISYYGASNSELLVKEAALSQSLSIKEGTVKFVLWEENTHLDFANNFFDCCLTVNTIYFWKEPMHYFEQIHRVLRAGGTFTLAFIEKESGADLPWTQRDFTFYDINEVKALFRNAGFVNIDISTLTEQLIGRDGKEKNRPFCIVTGTK